MLRLAVGALGSAAFLALVPRREFAISAAGGRSLQAYLAHGFIIKSAITMGAFGWLATFDLPVLTALLLLLAAWALVRLLASVPAARLLEPLTSPRWIEERLWRSRTG
jgi:fucose 4-O-acetylase-like acetyltransferase